MSETLRPRTVGELVAQTFSVVFKKLGKLIGIWIPFVVLELIIAAVVWAPFRGSGPETTRLALTVSQLCILILNMTLGPIPGAAAIIAISDAFTGKNHSVWQCYRVVIPMIWRLLVLLFVVSLIVLGGMVLLIIPGIILMLRYYVAYPALLVENLSVREALSRSSALTSGNKWRIFGLYLCMLVIGMGLELFFDIVKGVTVGFETTNYVVDSLIIICSNTVGSLIGQTAVVALYFDLRVRKDALHLEKLAEIVDRIAPQEA